MRCKILALILSLLALDSTGQAQAQCSPSDQISPNPNPVGNTITIDSAPACNGVLFNNFGTLDFRYSLSNYSTLNNFGSFRTPSPATELINRAGATLVNFGSTENRLVFTVNEGTLINEGSWRVGEGISNHGLLVNNGTMLNVGIESIVNRGGVFINNGHVGPSLRFRQEGGKTVIDGTVQAANFLIRGGELAGNGSIAKQPNPTGTDLAQGPVIIEGGIVAPGNDSPGVLTIFNDYTQTALGSFSAEIGGLTSGIEYDLLKVSGTATLAGTLNVTWFDLGVGSFNPHPGNTFDILSAENLLGTFNTLNLPGFDENRPFRWQVEYLADAFGTTDVVRLTVAPIPEPETYAMLTVGLGLLGWVARRKRLRAASRADGAANL